MATAFCNRLARIAEEQFTRFHWYHEADPPLSAQIERYWDGIRAFPGVGTPWSAVFVSWCLRRAGATHQDVRFSAQHSVFVHWAIRNAEQETGSFRGFAIDEASPEIGDLIQNNQPGLTFDFAHAKASHDYASHSAIVIETGNDAGGRYALTVGGNESDSVGRKLVRLDGQGRIRQRHRDPYICVVKNLK